MGDGDRLFADVPLLLIPVLLVCATGVSRRMVFIGKNATVPRMAAIAAISFLHHFPSSYY
jgi:hypothetical protein